jgi:hypothetical protein
LPSICCRNVTSVSNDSARAISTRPLHQLYLLSPLAATVTLKIGQKNSCAMNGLLRMIKPGVRIDRESGASMLFARVFKFILLTLLSHIAEM